jgi:Na+-driven multidrug efflux pump
MYGAVDLLVVGRFGTTAGLSGVSTGSNVLNVVTFTVTGCSMAVTILIGRYLWEKCNNKIMPLTSQIRNFMLNRRTQWVILLLRS